MTAYHFNKKSIRQDAEYLYAVVGKKHLFLSRSDDLEKVIKRSTNVGKITHAINNNAAKQTKLAKMLTNEQCDKDWHDRYLARGSALDCRG